MRSPISARLRLNHGRAPPYKQGKGFLISRSRQTGQLFITQDFQLRPRGICAQSHHLNAVRKRTHMDTVSSVLYQQIKVKEFSKKIIQLVKKVQVCIFKFLSFY